MGKLDIRPLCHSRGGGNPDKLIGLDSRLRGNDNEGK